VGPRTTLLLLALVPFLVAAALLPLAPAAARAPRPGPFVTEGQVLAPLRFAADPTYSTWPGGQRTLYTVAGSNGDAGYTFELPAGYDGGDFVLEVLSGATGQEDLDIAFYQSFSPVISSANLQTREPGGETGFVPDGTRYVIVTMFEGADAAFRFTALRPGAARTPKTYPLPETPGIYADFGKTTGPAAVLARRSHVVIALVDTGVNPYHVAFRRPEYVVHPSRYISGFPADSPALGLTLDGEGYAPSRHADDPAVWSQVGREKLYWIPGTNIIGAASFGEHEGGQPPEFEARPIIDDDSHGTGTASVAAGGGFSQTSQMPYGSNPEALMEWAASQPWIDFISGSYGDPAAVPANDLVPDETDEVWTSREYRYTGPFALRDGRTACFSAGNGLSRTGLAYDRYSSLRPTSGPSWVVTVGAVSPRNDQDYGWHSVPVDVSSYGNHWPAADAFSTEGEMVFSGTSNATPVTCGVFSKALLEARRAIGDRGEGIHTAPDGTLAPAVGRSAGGLVADGVLTRLELQDAVFKTAFPSPFDPKEWTYDPAVVPDTPAYYTQEGYGIANRESSALAVDVVLGLMEMPDRAEVDAWIAEWDAIRDSWWSPEEHDGA
jgi:hypothetical protein